MFLKLERPEMGDLAKENFGCTKNVNIKQYIKSKQFITAPSEVDTHMLFV